MSILNRPSDGLLSVLLVLRRALLAYAPMSRERLLELCAPEALVPRDTPSKTMIWKTLHRWLQLGFFRQDKEAIQLASEFERIPLDDVESVRTSRKPFS